MCNKIFIKINNIYKFVEIIQEHNNFLLLEDQNTFEEIIIEKKNLNITARFENNKWIDNNNEIFTIRNEILEGVFSREEIIDLKPNSNTVLISIFDSNKKRVDLKNENDFKDCLFLSFDDIEEDMEDLILFDKNIAKEIVDFVNKNKNSKFIINCEAGISRSAAIASFIEESLNLKNSDSSIKKHIRFSPNKLVFNTLVELLIK